MNIDLDKFQKMAEIEITELDRANLILSTVCRRFDELEEYIGEDGEIISLLSNSSFDVNAHSISKMFLELEQDVIELKDELSHVKENR